MIIGAGGHGKVIADIVLHSGDSVLGFLDDDPQKKEILGFPVLGLAADWERFSSDACFVLGIGSNHIREALAKKIMGQWYTAIHPSVRIGIDVEIGSGSVVMANAVINPGSRIGRHCIINTGAVVEHDNVLSDYVHVSPHATLCGTVSMGRRTHVGAAAVIKNNLAVCEDVTIGVGAAVIRDITEPGIYVGVPARRLPPEED